MDAEQVRQRALSFGAVAADYAEFRPGYPIEAVGWLAGPEPSAVLELGAGTGKLTAMLLAHGHDVVAVDPLAEMLGQMSAVAPAARRVVGSAEAVPVASSTVTTVVAAQAFHWFDKDRALPEIARVLRPGGTLALVWNVGDFSVPWVRRVLGLIGLGPDSLPADPLEGSPLFAPHERRGFRHWQRFSRAGLLGFVASSSRVVVMSEAERRDVLTEAGRLYDEYERGIDGMLMPWYAMCFRAVVVKDAADPAGTVSGPADDGVAIDIGRPRRS